MEEETRQTFYDIHTMLSQGFLESTEKDPWALALKSIHKIRKTLDKYTALRDLNRDKEARRAWKKFELEVKILENSLDPDWRARLQARP